MRIRQIITTMPPMRTNDARVGVDPRLWLLVSPALPVGGYSYSQGLEYAVAAGWIRDAAQTREWIAGLAGSVLAHQELPLLARIHRCARSGDAAGVARWNAYQLASRETFELRREDAQMGAALKRLLQALEGAHACAELPAEIAFVTSFALACVGWQISVADACAAFAWVWFDNQVAAAVKLVPLGQTEGQRLLLGFADGLGALTARALGCADDDLGMTAPGLAIASSAHEGQYSRLFRS